MRNRDWLVFGWLIGASALIAACSGEAAPQQTQPRTAGGDAVAVTVATVVRKPMPLDIRGIGTVEAFSTVSVRAQITGALNSVSFKEGEDVKQGQVLFTLDSRPLEAALQQSQANLDRDLAQAANARVQAGRFQELSERGIVSREQVQTSATTATALDSTVGADRAAVENAKVQLQYATITAPISGRTGALIVHEGNLVRANDTSPLVIINQVEPIYVSFGIPEADLPDFKRYLAQRTLSVEARPPNDTAPASVGTVTFVDNAVDQTTGTIRIKGTFPNGDRRLWPGQFVNAVVTLTTDQAAVVVPSIALQAGPDGAYVFVVKQDQTVEVRSVTVARTVGAETIIREGLAAGDMVITDGQLRLVAGSRISIKNEDSQKGTR